MIVSDGCAASEVVRHAHTGLHFIHGSAGSLAARMRELAENDELAAALGRAAYDWYWSDPWTTEVHVDTLVAHYTRVLEKRDGASEAPTAVQRFKLAAANPP